MQSATGQLRLPLTGHLWQFARDADPDCRELQRRHYSRRVYADGRDPAKFVGPGYHIVLVTADLKALFVWRKFRDDSGQVGINCAIFRNEGPARSSALILDAETFAWDRWPGERLYTYVNGEKVRSSNPGYCFICAGWRPCGYTKGGLRILEKGAPKSSKAGDGMKETWRDRELNRPFSRREILEMTCDVFFSYLTKTWSGSWVRPPEET